MFNMFVSVLIVGLLIVLFNQYTPESRVKTVVFWALAIIALIWFGRLIQYAVM